MRALRVIQAAIRDRVREAVASEAEPIGATRRAHRELDAEIARAIARGAEPSCSAGCSYCCHVHVDATETEVAIVARHLVARGDAAVYVEKLTARVAVVRAMDHDARWSAKIPCAMLGDDGRCTIYEVRPVRCRAFHSADAEACRDAFSGPAEPDPVTDPTLDRACEAAEQGYELALAERGLSAATTLLEPALLDALRAR